MAWLQQHHEARRAAQLAGRRRTAAGRSAGGAPFFLWLDTFDPHEPWDAPPYYVDWYDPGYRGEVLAHANYGRADYMTEAERQHTKALYAAEVSMVDKWIGRLLQQVDDLGYRRHDGGAAPLRPRPLLRRPRPAGQALPEPELLTGSTRA